MKSSEILKMIEAVSGPDMQATEIRNRLNEIDLMVSYFLRGINGGSILLPDGCIRYTRSRDALKKIRPKEWVFPVNFTKKQNGWVGHARSLTHDDGGDSATPLGLASEELAELYAILQAIEYERAHK